MFQESAKLFAIANEAYRRAASASGEDLRRNDALVSIVFAAASVEAFINELTELASTSPFMGEPQHPKIKAFGQLAEEVERSRGTIALKFLVAGQSFGHPYDKGVQPYQDFDLLVTLRNDLVHSRPRDRWTESPDGNDVMKPAPILDKLRNKRIVQDSHEHAGNLAWTDRIGTTAAARWACDTAGSMVRSVLEMLPEGHFRTIVEATYSVAFLTGSKFEPRFVLRLGAT